MRSGSSRAEKQVSAGLYRYRIILGAFGNRLDTNAAPADDGRHPWLWGAVMDVVVWLRSLGLGKYEAAFRENEIDETVLPSLTHEDLKELGVAVARAPREAARCHRCSASRCER